MAEWKVSGIVWPAPHRPVRIPRECRRFSEEGKGGMGRGHRAGLLTAGALTALAVLSACTGSPNDDPTTTRTTTSPSPTTSPTTSPSPTLSEEDAAKQEDIDAAESRYRDYVAIGNTVGQASGEDWYDQLIPYLGTPDLIAQHENYWTEVADKGIVQTGETKVDSIRVTKYEGNPLVASSTQIVTMEVCLDNTGMDTVRPDGTSTQQEGWPKRVIQNVLMQTQTDGRWTVNEAATSDPVREC